MAIHYTCDGCGHHITPDEARIHCLLCTDYDSCISCHSAGRISHSHHPSHRTQTHHPTPLPSPSSLKVPPLPANPRTPASRPPPENTPERYWGSLVSPWYTPSPIFSRLFDSIFTHFDPSSDPSRTTLMTPEVLSSVYDAMGYGIERNFPRWIQQEALNMGAGLNDADAHLAVMYRLFGYEHDMATRIPVGQEDPVWNGMPVLTKRSFRKVMFEELVDDPDHAWGCFNVLLKGVWPLVDPGTRAVFEYAEVPRGCLPGGPDMEYRERAGRWFGEVQKVQQELRERLGREQEGRRRLRESQRAARAARMNVRQGQAFRDAMVGGWMVDSSGRRYYEEGLIS